MLAGGRPASRNRPAAEIQKDQAWARHVRHGVLPWLVVHSEAARALARTAADLFSCTPRPPLLWPHQAVASSGASPQAYTGVAQAAAKIYREEGLLAYWKGNGVHVVRIFPYSAGAEAAESSEAGLR